MKNHKYHVYKIVEKLYNHIMIKCVNCQESH